MTYDDIDADALSETQEERYHERQRAAYHRALMAHPHPSDPDHPEAPEDYE